MLVLHKNTPVSRETLTFSQLFLKYLMFHVETENNTGHSK